MKLISGNGNDILAYMTDRGARTFNYFLLQDPNPNAAIDEEEPYFGFLHVNEKKNSTTLQSYSTSY